MSVVIVDYGASNLHGVKRAVERTGCQPLVTVRPQEIESADALIVPGVGAAEDTMRHLMAGGLIEPIREYVGSGRPFLGVCMGLQALMTFSEERGHHPCLDIVRGRVRPIRVEPGQLKVPHMGWNTVHQLRGHEIFDGIADDAYFYFVHSYVVEPEDPDLIIGETDYGEVFPAVIARGNLVATQFHPEKSGVNGLRVYANFVRAAAPTVASAELRSA